jgi:peptidoglycan/LPS O-acetylase OafA/YrhL
MNAIEKYGWVNAARGYAILLVVMIHIPQFLFTANSIALLTHTGDMGVQLFFVMSSFTLFNSYSKRAVDGATHTKRAFFVRRLFRIAPHYWLATAFYLALEILFSGNKILWSYLFFNVVFLNGVYVPAIVYLPPGGWSIGVEMAFYLTIPLLFRWTKDIWSAIALLAIAILASNALNFAEFVVITRHTTYDWEAMRTFKLYFWFPNQFPVFCFGILLYHVYRSIRISVRAGYGLLYAALIAFAALCFVPFSVEYPSYFFQKEYVYGLVFAIFAAGLYASKSAAFNNSLIQRIGLTSFSLYLNHFIVLMVLGAIERRYSAYLAHHDPAMLPWVRNDLTLIAYYVLAVFIAYKMSRVTYRYIELKGIKLGERVLVRLGWSHAYAPI